MKKTKAKKKKVVMKTNYFPNLEIESSVEIIKMIGAEIKRRRLKMSRTLSDYDLGCSLSYQCKIEHGDIIPKYQILLDYCMQNGITQEELNVMLTIDQKIDNYLEQMLLNDYSIIESDAIKTIKFNNYKVALLQMLYAYSIKDFDSIEKSLNYVYPLLPTLREIDQGLCHLFKIILNNNQGNYFDSYREYKKIGTIDNRTIRFLLKKEMVVTLCYGGFESAEYCYKDLIEDSMMYYGTIGTYYYETFLIAKYKSGYMLKDSELKILNRTEKIKYFGRFKLFDELLKLDVSELNDYEKLLYYLYLNKMKEASVYFRTTSINTISPSDFIETEYLFNLKRTISLDDYYSYLMKNLYNKLSIIQNIYFLKKIDIEVPDYLMEHKKYKDAAMFHDKISDIILEFQSPLIKYTIN